MSVAVEAGELAGEQDDGRLRTVALEVVRSMLPAPGIAGVRYGTQNYLDVVHEALAELAAAEEVNRAQLDATVLELLKACTEGFEHLSDRLSVSPRPHSAFARLRIALEALVAVQRRYDECHRALEAWSRDEGSPPAMAKVMKITAERAMVVDEAVAAARAWLGEGEGP